MSSLTGCVCVRWYSGPQVHAQGPSTSISRWTSVFIFISTPFFVLWHTVLLKFVNERIPPVDVRVNDPWDEQSSCWCAGGGRRGVKWRCHPPQQGSCPTGVMATCPHCRGPCGAEPVFPGTSPSLSQHFMQAPLWAPIQHTCVSAISLSLRHEILGIRNQSSTFL